MNTASPLISTQRLRLCPCTPADRADFMALERDPKVMRFLNGGFPVDQEEGDPHSLFLMPRGTEPHVWTARREDDVFVGWFCLWPDSDSVSELGYRLRSDQWGQGLASEGATALMGWGFGNPKLERVVACTMASNTASRRVMEKSGMAWVRTVKVDWAAAIPGGEQGEVHYELTRASWQRKATG